MNQLEDNEFEQQTAQKRAAIEEILKQSLPRVDSYQRTIFDAMEYSVLAGGKRIRPLLMQESHVLFGGTEQEALEKLMASIEMIHTYSLVHDDLPALDDDAFRRGKETTHKVFGEDMGLLAGDALLNYAYETALAGAMCAKEKEHALCAVSILAQKAGVFGMVGGQVVDVQMTGKTLTKDQLDFVYRLKTGALLSAALMAGAALAGADEESLRLMEEVGNSVGMAFQIQDDILDVTGTTEEIGKPAHSDEKNEKRTYVSLYGMEKARLAVKEYSTQALETLAALPQENTYLNTLIQKLVDRRK